MLTMTYEEVSQVVTYQTGKLRVLLVYIVYPFALATYFKKALQHRPDIDLRIAGPYTATWIPWSNRENPDGMTLPAKYAIPPDIPLPFPPNVGEINYDIIRAQLGDWKPDIIINIDAGLHFKYRTSDAYMVTVGTDPHVLNDWYDKPRVYSDKFFNMQLCYSKDGDIYLPYAYSRYDHYPTHNSYQHFQTGQLPPPEKDTDAVLIGMPYPNRVQWVNELRSRGVSVIFENGPVFDEARTLYNRGRIGLNWSSMNDLNARAFEIPAMKLFPVMNYVPDLSLFEFSQTNVHPFHNLEEAISRVMYAVENPENARLITEDAYEKVQGQTYDARINQILEESGFQ